MSLRSGTLGPSLLGAAWASPLMKRGGRDPTERPSRAAADTPSATFLTSLSPVHLGWFFRRPHRAAGQSRHPEPHKSTGVSLQLSMGVCPWGARGHPAYRTAAWHTEGTALLQFLPSVSGTLATTIESSGDAAPLPQVGPGLRQGSLSSDGGRRAFLPRCPRASTSPSTEGPGRVEDVGGTKGTDRTPS